MRTPRDCSATSRSTGAFGVTPPPRRRSSARCSRASSSSRASLPLGSLSPIGGEGRVRGQGSRASAMPNVLVTMRFNEGQLNRLRSVSPDLRVTYEDAEQADYSTTDILYAGMPPRDLARAPRLKWVQLHMAGVNALYDHPIYTDSPIILTTTSGVHGPTIAEYAITMLLALAHRVPRMVEWKTRGAWPPDEQRWPLFVPTEVRGAVVGIIGYGSIGRELARIAKSAFGMTVLACKRDPAVRA